MSWYWKTVWILFGIFFVANAVYLHRVPGLLGDEGSEGENVWEKLEVFSSGEPQTEHSVLVRGERSYIGPLIDYARVPFITIFGYTPLALRIPMLLAACATFWLAASVLRKLFGEVPALFALAFGFFNPIYFTQARLGWAITLFPFFTFLLLYLIPNPVRNQGRVLLAGLVAGIALSNHVLFLPTLVGIIITGIVSLLLKKDPSVSSELDHPPLRKGRKILALWPAVIGFAAGFMMQFTILLTSREDQGDVGAVAELASQRFADLPRLLPHVLSGSSYIASYTGTALSELWQWVIVGVVGLLVLPALFLRSHKKFAWALLLGLVIQLMVLLYMIDRFSLRYFAMLVVEVWILAGIGLGVLVDRYLHLRSVNKVGSVVVGVGLAVWFAFVVLIPFLKTGGSTNDFSLGNRTDSAAALVDTRPLVECLRGAGPVFSENVHIWNRLQFLSHEYSDLKVLSEDQKDSAKYLVEYRDAKNAEVGNLCPELVHFRVLENNETYEG